MFKWLTTNLRTLLLAFALAVAVWVSAVTAADPDETRTYPSPIIIEYIGQDSGLLLTGTVPQTVTVSLRAPSSVWNEMIANRGSVRAIADLSGLSAGDHNVPIQVQVAVQPVRVLSSTPVTLRLSLEPLDTRSLAVMLALSGEAAIGYQVGEAILNPERAVVSGPESLVARVDRLEASIDLTGSRSTIESLATIQALDSENRPVTGVTIQPDQVQINLPIVQIGGYRDLAVKVVTRGQPASGYRLTNISPFPPVVTVYSSNLELIESLPGFVETMPLDLTGIDEGLEARLELVLPAGVTLVGNQTIVVQVGVAPITSSLTISYRPVEVIGLGARLEVDVSPLTVDVILSGPLPVLDSLLASDIRVRVDVTGLAPGTYQLTPVVEILIDEVVVESILPGTIQVVITSTTTPTP
ncbi:MAG: hypothetical protein JXB85_17820 [Anaerolineales bacterium]|nr:hypothetical protein [Anaerolineales bacterium]